MADIAALQKQLDLYIETHKSEMLRDLETLVKIPSVRGKPSLGAPLGENVKAVLDAAAAMFEKNGFSAENHGKYVLAKHGGGKKQIGIFSHCDVVPAEKSAWKTDPFVPFIKDGCMIGRGAEDDKSGTVISLYAMKFFKESGIFLKNSLTAFAGGSEETTMEDIEDFAKTQKMPDMSLVPDCGFPLSIGEKGICRFFAESDIAFTDIKSFEGGDAFNIVLGSVKAEIACTDALLEELTTHAAGNAAYSIEYDEKTRLATVCATGTAKHAAMPEGSVNAAKLLAELLIKCKSLNDDDRLIMRFVYELTADSYGSGLKIKSQDRYFGALTAATGMTSVKNGHLRLSFDVRYGTDIPCSSILADVEDLLFENRFSMEVDEINDGFRIDENSGAIKSLLSVYREVSGQKDAKPFYSSGGTYARHLKNAVSVGVSAPYVQCGFSGGGAHMADEYICIDAFLQAFKIITLMIYAADEIL